MNFTAYSKNLRSLQEQINENTNLALKCKNKAESLECLKKLIHGAWRMLSQAVEKGEDRFTMVVSTRLLDLFIKDSSWTMDRLVKTFKEFGFNAEYSEPNQNGEVYGTRVIPPYDSTYVIKFTVKEKEPETTSWAEIMEKEDPST